MKFFKALLIGIVISFIILVLGMGLTFSSGLAGIFVLPVIFIWIVIAVIGSIISGVMISTNKISTKGARLGAIIKILFVGGTLLLLIFLWTFWGELFR